jgi:hypothetical protein
VKLRMNKNTSSCAAGPEVSYDSRMHQNQVTAPNVVFTPITVDNRDVVGGKLTLTATAVVNGISLNGESPDASIQGTNPTRASIQQAIDTEVERTGLAGISSSDESDALKRIACHESTQGKMPDIGGFGTEAI